MLLNADSCKVCNSNYFCEIRIRIGKDREKFLTACFHRYRGRHFWKIGCCCSCNSMTRRPIFHAPIICSENQETVFRKSKGLEMAFKRPVDRLPNSG